MALDGIFLHAVKRELSGWVGSRIDRINQPGREELVMTLRRRGGAAKLLLSANAGNARVHFTSRAPENPPSPPMFCMLLRKRLGSGRLSAVRQLECDRVLSLEFETKNELGDPVVYILSAEIMGRHSNLIVYDKQSGQVLDAIKRVDLSMSEVRPILPGQPYTPPPTQQKQNLLHADPADLVADICDKSALLPEKAVMQTVQGISPLVARELCLGLPDLAAGKLGLAEKAVLFDRLRALQQRLQNDDYAFTMLLDGSQPKDFTLLPVRQYGSLLQAKAFPSASELLDSFFVERDRAARTKQRSHDLLKLLQNACDRAARTLAVRQAELGRVQRRDDYRVYGDLLSANLYRLQKGQQTATLEDFYHDNRPVEIPLDPRKTPAQNAQRYYKEYKKAVHADEMLRGLIAQSVQEVEYLESVLDLADRTAGEVEISAIRAELAEQGYIRTQKQGARKQQKLPPLTYRSSDGLTILCGRNNRQNDELTLKKSAKTDLWLHTQKIHGSHVVVQAQGRPVPARTVEEAAVVAAYNSKGRSGAGIPVDYTLVRNVKKPNGARPGMVIFTDYQTLSVDPNPEIVERLRKNAEEAI